MSTNDTRAAFEAYAKKHWDATCNKFENGDYKYGHTTMLWKAWQAATEAAKATGTAGDALQDVRLDTAKQEIRYWKLKATESEAARQPAPVAIKTWQERMKTTKLTWKTGDGKLIAEYQLMAEEIAELRAALAATAAPVLSDEKLHKLWLNICMDEDKSVPRFIRFYRAILAATNRSQP